MGLEARNAAWDVERELDREEPSGASAGTAGPRADFLANLGRRVSELSSMLGALEREPGSARLRDDLRRRVHALGAGARLLRFERLAAEVAAAEERLVAVAERGHLDGADAAALRAAFGLLTGLAFGGTEADERRGEAGAAGARATLVGVGAPLASAGLAGSVAPSAAAAPRPWPLSVLVVGPKPIADAIVLPAAEGAPAIDVERTDDGLRAIDLARAVAPDVVVIDADRRGARELLEALRKDALTAGVAIVALGTWGRAEDASAFLAAGATRAVHKPVSPDALRRVCQQASVDREAAAPSAELGRVSLEELAARLGKEVERAIADGATLENDGVTVDLGRGDDVLGAVWSAAARVRDVVTIKSRGEIRFAPGAAERALPVGAWMNDPAGVSAPAAAAPRRGGVRPGPGGAKALAGVRVLVADDDPAVAWFLSGVLRGEGAAVIEACDGATALRKALAQGPDLVLSDVLMPNLDGLTLTEMLRADPLLADVGVVLLSWKDDLLQRARELGARADAYLRKDASGPTVAARVRELLYPRARLAERVAAGGEVHGRVDGLTMRTLLATVCTHRPACLIEVRDAAYLYEVDVVDGRPVRVTRTARDGAFVQGAAAFAQMLGVRAGRFVVTARREGAGPGEETPPLAEQLRPHAAAARGALRLLTGSSLPAIARVAFDADWVAGYGALLPSPARAIVKRLEAGEAPRKVLASCLSSARLFEEVVRDAAARGAIVGIRGAQGEDLLGPAVQAELDVLLGVKTASVAPAALGVAGGAGAPALVAAAGGAASEEAGAEEMSPSGVVVVPEALQGEAMLPAPALLASAAVDDIVARGEGVDPGAQMPLTGVPGSIGANDSAEPGLAGALAEPGAPKLAPTYLAAAASRAQARAADGAAAKNGAANGAATKSGAADGAATSDESDAEARASLSGAGLPMAGAAPPQLLTLGSLTPPPAVPRIEPEPPKAPSIKIARSSAAIEDDEESPPPRRSRRSEQRASKTPAAPDVKPAQSRTGMWIACAVAGIVFAVGARISQERRSAAPAAPPAVTAPAAPPSSAAPATTSAAASSVAAAPQNVVSLPGDSADDPILPQEAPLRADEKIPSGQGLLEVVVGPNDEVSIDGRPTVAGPVVKATLAPRDKPYEIKVKMRGEERLKFALVKEGKRTRVRVAPPWNR
jgi:CheY-like chemotaxis protein